MNREHWQALSALVLAAAGAAGCKTSPPAPASPGEKPVTVAATAPEGSASAGPSPGTRRADGCWGLDLPADQEARARVLTERCAPGTTALLPLKRVSLTAATEITLPATPRGACLRAFVVPMGGPVDAALTLGGVQLARDGDAAFAVVPRGGPACPGPGSLKLALRGGADAVEAWVTVVSTVAN